VVGPPRRLHVTWENDGHCPGTVVEVELRPLSEDAVEMTLLDVGKPIPHEHVVTRDLTGPFPRRNGRRPSQGRLTGPIVSR
jgi:hypothetical protein